MREMVRRQKESKKVFEVETAYRIYGDGDSDAIGITNISIHSMSFSIIFIYSFSSWITFFFSFSLFHDTKI